MDLSQKKNNKRNKFYALLTFVTGLVASVFILSNINDNWQHLRKHDLQHLVEAHATSVEQSVSRSVSSAKIVAAWLNSHNGEISGFDDFAKEVIISMDGITNLQLAPNGVVKHIYPLAGHEKALGHNILKDDKRVSEAKLAVLSNKLTLSGPYELIQGGIALIGRQPIFFDKTSANNSNSSPNKHYFWGFASALISLETLLLESSLSDLEKRGDSFQLWKYSADTGEKDIFYKNTAENVSERIQATMEMPNAIWYLNIEESLKLEHDPELFISAIILFLFDILLACSVYQYLSNRKVKFTS